MIFYIYGESYSRRREEHDFLGDTSRFDPQYAPFFYSGFESNYKNIYLQQVLVNIFHIVRVIKLVTYSKVSLKQGLSLI